MGVFIILLFVPVLMQHTTLGKKYINCEKKYRLALLLFFLLLTILLAFRHERVGNDTRNYIYYFHRIIGMDWVEVRKYPIEIGFAYFNKVVSIFSSSSRIYLSIVAFITVALIYPTYKRLCKDPSLTIALFCIMPTFVMLFSGIRQMLAISIGVVAYEFSRNKKPIEFILCVLLAVTVHTSAFVIGFMYPLYHIKITKKWLFWLVPLISLVFVFNKQIFYLLEMLISRFTRYEGKVSSTGAYTMILLFAIFVVFSFLVPNEALLDKETVGLRNFLLFSLVIQMFAPVHMLAMRMNFYYIIFIPLLLPKIIQFRNKRWNQVAVVARHVMIVFFFSYFLISANGGGNLHVFPYHFFWEGI